MNSTTSESNNTSSTTFQNTSPQQSLMVVTQGSALEAFPHLMFPVSNLLFSVLEAQVRFKQTA